MAPALTQASESPDLTDATRHSLPPKAITNIRSPDDHIKTLKESTKSSFESILIPDSVLISNGDCFPSGLAPPACGRAEGRPEPSTLLPRQFNMEEFPPVSSSRNSGEQENFVLPESGSSLEINMGLQSCVRNASIASDTNGKGSEVSTSSLPTTEAILNNQTDFLALMGQDFNNVNDIIDTLQSLASNPEFLDEATRDLETNTTAVSQCTVLLEDRPSIALNHLLEKQAQLERRKNFLIRRLHRITARGLGVTISNQLSHLIRYSRSIIDNDQVAKRKGSLRNKSARLESFHQDSMKSMSTSDLISLVKHVEASSNKKVCGNYDHNIYANVSLPSQFCSEVSSVVAEWKAGTLGHINHDSDATESSSGGESCDESEQFNKANIDYKPIHQRAFYKYYKHRGRIASKWMWLQSQIAELDKKISLQEEFHLKLNKEKENVKLLERATNQHKGRRSPADLNMQDPALTCIASPSSTRTTINGYHPINKVDTGMCGSEVLSESECARTVGVHKVKRRKYINLRKILKRSISGRESVPTDSKYNGKQQLTSVHCHCNPSSQSCVLCLDSSRTVALSIGNSDILCNQTIKQKLAVIDSSFHPVLSTKPGVLQSETYNKLLRSWEWQQKTFKSKPRMKPSNLMASKDLPHADTDEEDQYEIPFKRRRKDMKRTLKKTRDERSLAHRVTRRNHGSSFDDDEDELSGGWVVGSSHSSPCPSPNLERAAKADTNGSDAREARRSRKHSNSISSTGASNNATASSSSHRIKQSSNSYDINNIVIPCMAAPPKLETIKYKEIPTPKWRIDDIRPLNISNLIELEEDISDDAFNARHCRSEALERKKFFSYLQANHVGSSRSSRSRRTDSSGTNTPDHPLSPRGLENSPAGSPPSTPQLPPSEDSLPASDAACEGQTVLSLSLSSILSGENKSIVSNTKSLTAHRNPIPDDTGSNAGEFVSSTKPEPIVHRDEPKPGLRTRRLLSGHNQERPLRSMSISSVAEDPNDRASPFPCREFPLTENDYQVLVTESSTSRESSSKSRLQSAQRDPMDNVVEMASINELESGPRDSPLSELTDSALEEDATWEDESAPPDWTISAVHDHSGGFVLKVQKN